MPNPLSRYKRDTVNDLSPYSLATEFQLVLLGVFIVFALFIPFFRRIWCAAAHLPNTEPMDERYNGVVTQDWLDNQLSFYVNELERQLNIDYTATDVLSTSDNPRCKIYAKLTQLLPNQLIAVANEYKNKKCKTIRQAISETRYSGCGIVDVTFGTTSEELLIQKLDLFNIT